MGVCKHLFFNTNADTQTLDRRVRPSDAQMEYLQAKWPTLAQHLKSYLNEASGFPIETWIQGSYKFGTLIRPAKMNEGFDVDLGVYLVWTSAEDDTEEVPSAKEVKDLVQDACREYIDPDVIEVVEPAKIRCSRVRFSRQFHIDVPGYKLVHDEDERWLATEEGYWEDSDPKAIVRWFKDKVDKDDRQQLKRIIRYLKMWATLNFVSEMESARPSSILLTVLAVEAFDAMPATKDDDDDAFAWMVGHIVKRLRRNPAVMNPTNNREDLNRLKGNDRSVLVDQFEELAASAGAASNAQDEFTAANIWSSIFGHFFPLPEQEHLAKVTASMPALYRPRQPDVLIVAKDRRTGKEVGHWRNAVDRVWKDCDLTFTVQNPQDFPKDAYWRWTVRNEGDEAENSNDLGHHQAGRSMLEVDEHTAYVGRHHLDCLVLGAGGAVIGARRIPVNIIGYRYVERNPKRPAWVKLRSGTR